MRNITIHVVPHPQGWVASCEHAPTFTQLFSRRRDALAWVHGYAEGSEDAVTVDAGSATRGMVDFLKLQFDRARHPTRQVEALR